MWVAVVQIVKSGRIGIDRFSVGIGIAARKPTAAASMVRNSMVRYGSCSAATRRRGDGCGAVSRTAACHHGRGRAGCALSRVTRPGAPVARSASCSRERSTDDATTAATTSTTVARSALFQKNGWPKISAATVPGPSTSIRGYRTIGRPKIRN
jgi:hypothetical protein